MKKHFKELIILINWPKFLKLWMSIALIMIVGYLISLLNGRNVFPAELNVLFLCILGAFIVFFGHSIINYMEHLMRLKHEESKKQKLNK
jgi:hypothetical protein